MERSGAAMAAGNLQDMEWQMIETSLRIHGGNKTAAARSLGISLRTLYNKLEAKSPKLHSPSAASSQ
jgi:transcriptional regulator with PAS, ATPase and Fis domain